MQIALLVGLLIFLPATTYGQRMIFMDVFTNSHCTPCASMHAAVDAQVHATEIKDRVIEIYHHVPVYLDDELYRHNTVEPMQRGALLGGVTGTPTVFISGSRYRGSWSAIGQAIETELSKQQEAEITGTATISGNEIITTITVRRSSNVLNDAAVYAAVVEDLSYCGRNGVCDRNNVFRAGLTPPAGQNIIFDNTGLASITLRVPVRDQWVLTSTSVIVALQQVGGGVVYQGVELPIVMSPTSVNIENTQPVIEHADIYTLTGQFVQRIVGPSATLTSLLSTSSLERGLYMVRTPTSSTLVFR